MARNLVAAMVDLLFFAANGSGKMSLSLTNLQFLDWQPVSMSIEPGEAVCVRGGSGSGKSLLLRAVVDLIPNEGDVRLGDEIRSEMNAADWRRRVGYLPAEVLWWEDRVGDHFLNTPSAKHFESLKLESDCLDWHPHRLSMGERQRLGLLRLFDRKPEALLLDEPTSNLDDGTSSRVEELIFEYLKENETPAIWVTHDREQADRVGPRRYLMEGKELKEDFVG